MAQKNILIIDDEKVVHLIFKTVLNDSYNLFFAENAQEGIDILSENPVHLLLLDINMPEITGIELLESLVVDTAMNRIPVIIMTAESTMDAEIKARRLGVAHFLEKSDLFYEKKNILDLVEKFVSNEDPKTFIRYDYKQTFRSILTILIAAAEKGDKTAAIKKLGEGLFRMFDINIFTLSQIDSSGPKPIIRLVNGIEELPTGKTGDPTGSKKFAANYNEPYLDNKALKENPLTEDDEGIGYMPEIGIPLFAINSDDLIRNQWKVPPDSKLYGFITLKRNRLFSTKEFKVLTRFITHTGAILFEFFWKELNRKEIDGA